MSPCPHGVEGGTCEACDRAFLELAGLEPSRPSSLDTWREAIGEHPD